MIPYGRRLTLALVAALVVVAATGGGLAYLVARGGQAHAGVPGTPQPAVRTGSTTARAAASSSVSAPGTASAEPSAAAPLAVSLSPSAENAPHARDVADLVTRLFGAINRHDYDAWLTTVSTAQARRDRDSWTHDYSTTRDSDIYISDIVAGPPMTVRLQFMSHQSLALAPTGLKAECVRWDVTYRIVDEGVGLRVGNSAKSPAMAPC